MIYTNTKYDYNGRKRKQKKVKNQCCKYKKQYIPMESVKQEANDHREKYKSVSMTTGNTHKKENMKYTGTLITGIATMHKSNAVPVLNEQDAKDISNMRRN